MEEHSHRLIKKSIDATSEYVYDEIICEDFLSPETSNALFREFLFCFSKMGKGETPSQVPEYAVDAFVCFFLARMVWCVKETKKQHPMTPVNADFPPKSNSQCRFPSKSITKDSSPSDAITIIYNTAWYTSVMLGNITGTPSTASISLTSTNLTFCR